MRRGGLPGSVLAATLFYAVATIALTWPVVPRAARDVPGDLLDPLFTCWALGWNFHYFGLSNPGPRPGSYWDANIFYPTPMSLARSEHFLAQALQGAPVYALTHSLVLTYNVLFLSTFVLSGLFLYLLARDETGDAWAALAAGLFYAFALFRWTQVEHLGALSSQWMPLALLLARRVARGGRPRATAGSVLALGVVTAVQLISSGYYLLFFPPFLILWAAVEAKRAGGGTPWLRLAAAGLVVAVLAAPMVLPYVALRASGAERHLGSVVEHSADLLSLVTAPELTRVWGPILDAFPRGEARLFPGVVTPLLALGAVIGAARASRGGDATVGVQSTGWPPRLRQLARLAAVGLGATGTAAALAALTGGWSGTVGPLRLRAVGLSRPACVTAAAFVAAWAGWPRLRPFVRAMVARREVLAVAFATLAAWLSLGPLVTIRGWPSVLPSPYRWLYENVPGFSAGRAPARFAMIAACFAALAAAWGLKHLRTAATGRRLAWLLGGAFLVETAAVPLPLSRQWNTEGVAALPEWRGGKPSPIVASIRSLPEDAVLALLPFGELFHETRAMFDSAHHWRRLLNGYSSWPPAEYREHAFALRDPPRRATEVVAALRAAGATHLVVEERAWRGRKGEHVTQRLLDAGAQPVARAEDEVLLALPWPSPRSRSADGVNRAAARTRSYFSPSTRYSSESDRLKP
jgi:hypothetical protein